jgi:hypothetical protein
MGGSIGSAGSFGSRLRLIILITSKFDEEK